MAEELVLDDRMTDETKNFITNLFKFMKPNSIPKTDVKLTRAHGDMNNDKVNNTIKLDNISVENFFIQNKTDSYQIPVQIMAPKSNNQSKSNLPITIFFHGGGWTLGSLKSHFYTLVKLVNSTNSIWISIDYRLAPEFKFAIQLEDVRSAVEWVLNNKTKYTSATAKIGLSGDSAGGHWACMMAHEYREKIDYQILIYPCVDMSNNPNKYASNREFRNEMYFLTWELIDWFVKNVLDETKDLDSPKYSPLYQDLGKIPKTLIISAELDPFIDMAKAYNEKAKSIPGNCIEMVVLKGTLHGFFNSGPPCDKAINEAVRHATEFLNKVRASGNTEVKSVDKKEQQNNEKMVEQTNESCNCSLM